MSAVLHSVKSVCVICARKVGWRESRSLSELINIRPVICHVLTVKVIKGSVP